MNRTAFVDVPVLSILLWTFACGAPGSTEFSSEADSLDSKQLVLEENFETTTKSSYGESIVTLPSGPWMFRDALIGNLNSDVKVGNNAVRIRNQGEVRMDFDLPHGAGKVFLRSASFGKDPGTEWELWSSEDSGAHWERVKDPILPSHDLQEFVFDINKSGTIRFAIRKTKADFYRINVDEIRITSFVPAYVSPHLVTGIPVDSDPNDDYLILRKQYAVSYNHNKNVPNWVSWSLSASDFGDVPRHKGNFIEDDSLPDGWYRVKHSDYTNSGYDRGHMTRSEERTTTVEDNDATFIMSNVLPQKHDMNAGPWLKLEVYCQLLAQMSGKQMYVVAGGVFSPAYTTIGNGVAVPESTYKIVVILDQGQDLLDISESTRVIAVNEPNITGILRDDWKKYRVSVDELESLTGYNFLPDVPKQIQDVLEAHVDQDEQ